jgi:Nucleoside diphosphate kinase
MDRTFLMIKPDGVQRGLVGEIVARFEKKGLKLVAAKFERLPESRVMEHYAEHVSKPFFPGLKSYIMSGPCFLMVWEGKNVVSITRQMIGATNPAEALPGTIRGDFALEIGMNVIHGSDSNETAKREIAIHFKE